MAKINLKEMSYDEALLERVKAHDIAKAKGKVFKTHYDQKSILRVFEREGIPPFRFELMIFQDSSHRFDLAWADQRVYLEVDGGIYLTGKRTGAHSRGNGMKGDWGKRNKACSLGWRGMICQPTDILSRTTIEYLRRSLAFLKKL